MSYILLTVAKANDENQTNRSRYFGHCYWLSTQPVKLVERNKPQSKSSEDNGNDPREKYNRARIVNSQMINASCLEIMVRYV